MKKLILACAITSLMAGAVYAKGDKPHRSGAKGQGELGSVIINPYTNAPLTAIIDLGGKNISNVRVNVKGNDADGIDINYDVMPESVLTHNGIPVVGLYANHLNSVNVTYTLAGKTVNENYKIQTSPIRTVTVDGQVRAWPIIEPLKVASGFEDRMYFYNNSVKTPFSGEVSWANGGALTWDFDAAHLFVADTEGDTRWYFNPEFFDGKKDLKYRGTMHMYQVEDGNWIWMKGQSYGMMDMLGRILWERPMPRGFVDGSHEILLAENDRIILRLGKKGYQRDDGQRVTTVRDHVVEVDPLTGNVTHVWDLSKALDPFRDVAMKSQDPSAVCMNIDLDKVGEKAVIEPDAPFGDLSGVSVGRNWAHINSIDYDPSDDSIILSVRQQSAVVKIGRDNDVKWILASPEGWNTKLANKVLTPVDSKGKKLKCVNNQCEGGFDYTWAQHTAFLTGKGTLTVFDNGDGRGMEQPALMEMNYSRGVEYRINEKEGTVEQIWEFGKDYGYELYSPVVSLIQYQSDRDTHLIHFGSTGLFNRGEVSTPTLFEVSASDPKDIKVKMKMHHVAPGLISYRARIIDFNRAL